MAGKLWDYMWEQSPVQIVVAVTACLVPGPHFAFIVLANKVVCHLYSSFPGKELMTALTLLRLKRSALERRQLLPEGQLTPFQHFLDMFKPCSVQRWTFGIGTSYLEAWWVLCMAALRLVAVYS